MNLTPPPDPARQPVPDCRVVIVHYNTPELTRACIASVLAHTKGVKAEVVVVDNGSTVGDISDIKSWPGVRLIETGRNLGFAGGNNTGLAGSTARYVLLLNSDTEFTEGDPISTMVQLMDQHPKWGVMSGALKYPDGRPQYPAGRFPSIKHEVIELLRLPKLMSRRQQARHYLGDRWPASEATRADWVWGAMMMIRREALAGLPGGRLSERFFLYYEDVEWCWQISRLGYEVWYHPSAVAVHHLSASGEGTGEWRKYLDKVLPNQIAFLRHYRGSLYTRLYLRLKAWHLRSLRTVHGREHAAALESYF